MAAAVADRQMGAGSQNMNAIIKYPGSKWSIAKWIISHFPPHHSYLEPFFGSGAVLFNKQRSPIETVNDLDGDVVNLFEWIRDDPEKLAAAIYWTPYSREVYNRAAAAYKTETDSFQRALIFCTKMMMGHGFRTNEIKVGWKNDVQGREAAYAAKGWCAMPTRIKEAAERLRGVQIENRAALEVIRRFNFPNVLIYADPPYVLSTRYGKQYRCEMTVEDHAELLTTLKDHSGPVLLSGYDNPLYNEMLQNWHREEIDTRAQTAGKRQEMLWMNFEPPVEQIQIFKEDRA